MNRLETAQLLSTIMMIDDRLKFEDPSADGFENDEDFSMRRPDENPHVGPWQMVLFDVDAAAAVMAVREHYRTSPYPIRPVDIVTGARRFEAAAERRRLLAEIEAAPGGRETLAAVAARLHGDPVTGPQNIRVIRVAHERVCGRGRVGM